LGLVLRGVGRPRERKRAARWREGKEVHGLELLG